MIRLRLHTTDVNPWSEKADQPYEAQTRKFLSEVGLASADFAEEIKETTSVNSWSFI